MEHLALYLGVWAVGVLALYIATRRLLPLIVAHSLWDVLPGLLGTGGLAALLCVVAFVGSGTVGAIYLVRTPHQPTGR